MPWKYDIMKKRILYLWKILNSDKSELISRVYESQLNASHIGDWVRLVANDKVKIELDLSDEEIRKLSKTKFQTIVNSKVENFALSELNELKSKHSKSHYLKSTSFQTADYLKDFRFSKLESQLLFELRSQTLNVKANFPKQYNDVWCQVCKLFPESQSHLLQCPQIAPKLKLVCAKISDLDEKLIYRDTENQLRIVKIYTQILEIRKSMLEDEE